MTAVLDLPIFLNEVSSSVLVAAHIITMETKKRYCLSFLLCVTLCLCIPVTTEDTTCPVECHCERGSKHINCQGAGLHQIPKIPTWTTTLDLRDNDITVIKNDTWWAGSELHTLFLSNNSIAEIQAGAFVNLNWLEILDISSNKLMALPDKLLLKNEQLEILDLSSNLFSIIPENAMFNLKNLRTLNISYNHLSSPVMGPGFKDTPQISVLDLSGNNFPVLETHAFQALLWWNQNVLLNLNLSYCGVETIEPGAFKEFYHLESLSLRGNSEISLWNLQQALLEIGPYTLKELDVSNMAINDSYALFSIFKQKKLQKLNLSGNNIEIIPPKTFYFLNSLRELDLSINQLTKVGDMSGLSNLQTLLLGDNLLSTVSETQIEKLPRLRTLDVSMNQISQISDTPFQKLFYIQEINLSHNNLSVFSVSTGLERLLILKMQHNSMKDLQFIQRLPRLHTLDLSYNDFDYLNSESCLAGQSFKVMNLSHNNINSMKEHAFHQCKIQVLDLSYNSISELLKPSWTGLQDLNLSNNMISWISNNALKGLSHLETLDLNMNLLQNLQQYCLKDLHNLLYLDLSHNNFSDFLETNGARLELNSLASLRGIDLSYNNLGWLQDGLFFNLLHLKHVDFSNNNISHIASNAFYGSTSLSSLDLSSNNLSIVDPTAFEQIPYLRVLNLADNPFDCTCKLMPFKLWKEKSNVSSLFENIKGDYICASPPEWEGTYLKHFQLPSMTCTHQEKAVILAIVSCALLAVLMIVGAVAYRNRGWVQQRMARIHHQSMYDSFTLDSPRHTAI